MVAEVIRTGVPAPDQDIREYPRHAGIESCPPFFNLEDAMPSQRTMTITEALAEIKLVDRKVAAKQEFINSYLTRQACVVDPLGDSGGSRKVLDQEQQSVKDLMEQKVKIRRAIQDANARTEVTVDGDTRTVADWLVWRREVAPGEQQYLRNLKARIDQARNTAHQNRIALVAAEKDPANSTDLLVNVSEMKVAKRAEQVETILAALDGQLSLKNATTSVTF